MNIRNFTLLTLAVLICLCVSVGAFAWYIGASLLALVAGIATLAHGHDAMEHDAFDDALDVSPQGWAIAETSHDDMAISPYLTLPLRNVEDITRKS